MTGFLAAAVAIGVSTLAAGFVRPQASPMAAMGSVFIDRIPAALRNVVVQHFGTNGRTVLLLGMYAAIAVLAVGIGVLARRAAAPAVAGLAAFSLLAAFVTITRPGGHVSDVAPAVIGGIAGVAALLWLVHASTPIAPRAVRARRRPQEVTMTTTVDRRKFLTAAGVTAVGAAAAGVGGELLLGKHFRTTPPAASLAPSVPKAKVPKLQIQPMTPLPADETLNIAGLSPFYTPDADFYRVDTALVLPQVAAATWQLRIHGMVDNPVTLTFDQLIQRPMVEHDVTLTCVSEAVGGGYIGNARWQGMLLADVLREAGIQSGADQIVMRDVKGMTIGVATEPVMDGRKSLLAVGMNGQLLPRSTVTRCGWWCPDCTATCPRPNGWWTWNSPPSARSTPTG